ncbi:MAG: HIT domain-containing protein [bacterium]|nr:HIT domain-containing protein [bacterium]
MKDPNCVFCKIVKGEITAYKVYEDENFLAFLDINPRAAGHVQIIPKEHYRWVWQVPNAGEFFEIAKKIALAQQKAFNTDFIISKIVGDEVPHAHIWVFPGTKDVAPPSQSFGGASKKDFEGNAERIRKFIS